MLKVKDTKFLEQFGVDVEKSLELFGDMETYNQMLEEFLMQAEKKLDEAKKYKDASDLTNYEVIVHSLKSDFKYFGAFSVADEFYKHEMAAKNGDLTFIRSDFDNLIKNGLNMINVFKKYKGEDTKETISPATNNVDIKENTILVADDSNIIRSFVDKIFKDSHNIMLANDGASVLNILKSDKINNLSCMLLDLNMPKVNGFEVLDYMEKNNLFEKVPVSIITGMDDGETINKAFNYPIVDVIQKPFNEEKVKTATIKTIERKNS